VGTGGGQRGRRDNGLVAAEYAVAGDVDPRVGEHLLDVLAAGGIAAYLQPAADLHPVTMTTTLPARPADRLFVDREHLDTAREYLAQVAESNAATGVPSAVVAAATAAEGIDIDAEFARIVAGFHGGSGGDADIADGRDTDIADGRDADEGGAAGPEPGDRDSADADPADLVTAERPARRRSEIDQPTLLDALDTFGADLPDDEDSYTPPPPPPLPRLSAPAVVSLLAVVCGFVLFLAPRLMPLNEDLVRLLGFAACAGGVVGLIWRLRPGDEDDEYYDPDDGARV
jgi:hypothetical protein